jgi:ribosomal protein L18
VTLPTCERDGADPGLWGRLAGKVIAEQAKAANITAVHWEKPHGKKFAGKLEALINTIRREGIAFN